MNLRLIVACLCLVLPHLSGAAEPLIGAWRLLDGRTMIFTADRKGEIIADGKTESTGTWEADPFVEDIKRYAATWSSGQVFDIEVSRDGGLLRGKRAIEVKGAPPITAERLQEIRFQLWINDYGTLAVNGRKAAQANLREPAKGTLLVKAGDVISVDANNRTGVIELGFECSKDGARYLTAAEMYYTTTPAEGWREGKIEMGYRRPLTRTKQDMNLNGVAGIRVAMPQKEDEKAKALYFKFVVK